MIGAWCVLDASAQQFDEFFEDATLRLDYVLAGDSKLRVVQINRNGNIRAITEIT